MKFMVMHKADALSETEPKPTSELLANVGNLVKGAIDSGALIDAAGLRSSARRARVKLGGGDRTVQRGPYRGENELVASMALLKVKTMEQAVEWGARLADAAGAPEVEVGMVTEPWDLGVAPKPDGDVPLRVLALLKAGDESERGKAPTAEQLERAIAEAKAADVLVSTHALRESERGARIRGAKGARHVVDGPFAESKELIGGFMIMTFASKEEAVQFGVRYADVVGAEEVDIREVW